MSICKETDDDFKNTSDKDNKAIVDYLKHFANTDDKFDAKVLEWINSEITRLEIVSGIFDIAADEDIISVALLELSNKYRAEHKDEASNKVAQIRTKYLDKCDENKRLGKYIETNLNYHIKVKLNELGEKLYNDYWKDVFPEKDDFIDRLEKDNYGYYTFQMWEFMQIFGQHLNFGRKPFMNFNVLIERMDE